MKFSMNFLMGTLLLLLVSCGQEGPKTIFMIGDSTMANKPLKDGNQERGWGQMLPEVLTEEIKVDNHAVNGRSSLSFINEGRWDTVLVRIKPGDYVFIQFGHNDEKPDAKRHTDPGTTFDENLARFVRETREKGGYPVLFNSIVRRNFQPKDAERKGSYEVEGDTLIDTHGAYLESPRKVADEMNVPFVDMNALTHQLVCRMGREESKKMYMWIPAGVYDFCPKGKVDNTHLNRYGAKVMAALVMEEVAIKVPDLAKYLRHYSPNVYIADYRDNKECALSYAPDMTCDTLSKTILNKQLKDSFQQGAWLVLNAQQTDSCKDVLADTAFLSECFHGFGAEWEQAWMGDFQDIESYLKARKNTCLKITSKPHSISIKPSMVGVEKSPATLTMVLKKNNIDSVSVKQQGRIFSVKTLDDVFLFDFNPRGKSIEITY